MPNKTIYISDEDMAAWDAVDAIARRRRSSMSKIISGQLRQLARQDQQGARLPIGFKVPDSMKDPGQLRRERLADDFRAMFLEALEKAEAES